MSFISFVVLGGTLFDRLDGKQDTNLASNLFFATFPYPIEESSMFGFTKFYGLIGEATHQLKLLTKGIRSCHFV